jgi:hypothetical protein
MRSVATRAMCERTSPSMRRRRSLLAGARARRSRRTCYGLRRERLVYRLTLVSAGGRRRPDVAGVLIRTGGGGLVVERPHRCARVWGTRMGCAVVACFVLAMGAAACGSNDETADASTPAEREIRAAVENIASAMRSQDGELACAHFSATVRSGFAAQGKDCASGFHALVRSPTFSEDPNPEIRGIEVRGKTAIVRGLGRQRAPGSTQKQERPRAQTAEAVEENGKWKISEWFRD